MAKYTYETLKSQLQMLARDNRVNIAHLRVFYPKAGWTELISAVKALAESDNAVTFNPSNNMIEVQ